MIETQYAYFRFPTQWCWLTDKQKNDVIEKLTASGIIPKGFGSKLPLDERLEAIKLYVDGGFGSGFDFQEHSKKLKVCLTCQYKTKNCTCDKIR